MNTKLLKIICIIFLIYFVFTGCKGKSAQNTQKQVVTEEIIEESRESVISTPESHENNKPRITGIDISNPFPKLGDLLRATVTSFDADGDEITYIYEWSKAGEIISREEILELSLDKFKRGDEIKLKVIPYDGKVEGDAGYAEIIIGNAPPEIISSPKEGKVENRLFTYYVKAIDPDGDPLTYSLKEAPDGMTIDDNGIIKWPIPPEFKGRVSVKVSVTDGHGGEAIYTFEVNAGIEGK